MPLPNAVRIILLVASILSFIPQLRLLLVRRDSSGLSLYYVLLNLLVSIELVTVAAFFVITLADVGSVTFVNEPPDTGDWINLAQLAVIFLLWLLTFTLTIIFSPPGRGRHIAAAITLSTLYLVISAAPLIADAATPHDQHPYDQDRKWFIAFFEGAHVLFLTPVMTMLAAATLGAQAPAIRPDGARGLSLEGLAAQAVVFALLALSWQWRLRWPGPGVMFATWYQCVGFVPVDHAVFAVVQAILLWIAVRRSRQRATAVSEREPLIRGDSHRVADESSPLDTE